MATRIRHLFNDSSETQVITWLKDSAKLFLKAPIKLTLLLIGVQVLAGVIQVLPAPYNMFLSKLSVVFTSAALWIVIALIQRHGKLGFKGFTNYRNWFSVLCVSPLLLLAFASQILMAYALIGQSGVDLLLYGTLIDISANTAGLLFAAGAPLPVLFLFILPAAILDNKDPLEATIKGVNMIFKAPKSMLVILVLNALVLFFAPATFGLSAMLWGPFLLCLHFVAYESLKSNQSKHAVI